MSTLALCACLAWQGSAHALDDSSKAAVRALSNEAASDYTQGNFSAARDKFQRAYSVAHVPKLAVWLARAEEKLGRLVVASELYRQALALEPNDLWRGSAQQAAQKEAQAELEKLLPRIARLTILIEGAKPSDVSVSVDDVAIPSDLIGVERFADPGTRQVVAKRGSDTVSQTLVLTEGDNQRVRLDFTQSPKSGIPIRPAASLESAQQALTPPVRDKQSVIGGSTAATARPAVTRPDQPKETDSQETSAAFQRKLGWAGLGVGAAGVTLGATVGILVALKYGDLKSKCPNRTCDADSQAELDSYRSLRTVSTVGFIVGGVGTALGIAVLLNGSAHQKPQPSASLVVAPGKVAIEGRF